MDNCLYYLMVIHMVSESVKKVPIPTNTVVVATGSKGAIQHKLFYFQDLLNFYLSNLKNK